MSVTPLPQEILDHLVDSAREDFGSLKNLALTSSLLLQRSQSHLFRKLQIVQSVSGAQKNILKYNPSLFGNARQVYLSFDFSRPSTGSLGDSGFQTVLSQIVDELRNLEVLHLQPGNHIGQNWDQLPPISQSIIENLLRRHGLRHLILKSFHDFPSSLILPPLMNTLERCRTYEVTFKNEPMQTIVAGVTSLHARTLLCHGSIDSMAQLLRTPPFHTPALLNLVNLQLVMVRTEQHSHSLKMVLQTSHNLKALTLDYRNELSTDSWLAERMQNHFSLALPSIPSLRYLKLFVFAISSRQQRNCAPAAIPRFLHALLSVNPQPALELLKLQFLWKPREEVRYGPHGEADHEVLLSPEEWGPLDGALSDLSKYPSLIAVSLQPSADLLWEPVSPVSGEDSPASAKSPFESQADECMKATRERLPAFDGFIYGTIPHEKRLLLEEMQSSIFGQWSMEDEPF